MNEMSLGESPFGSIREILHKKTFWIMLVMIVAIFISALGVEYDQADNRMLFNQLTLLQRERDALNVERAQLLLEESTWSTQSRVQKAATEKLNMIMPNQKNIVIVQE